MFCSLEDPEFSDKTLSSPFVDKFALSKQNLCREERWQVGAILIHWKIYNPESGIPSRRICRLAGEVRVQVTFLFLKITLFILLHGHSLRNLTRSFNNSTQAESS